MNFITQFEQLFPKQERGIAQIIGFRGDSSIAQTHTGATLILKGVSVSIGKQCYYDRRSFNILGEAPNVQYQIYAIK